MSKKNFVFGVNPNIYKRRSKFKLNYSHKTTLSTGDLIPCYLQEVYPGDTFKGSSTFVIRTTNPFLKVPMDNLFLDISYFWVPNRLVYDKWKNVMGENTESAWIPESSTFVPMITNTSSSTASNNISNYFGIPIGSNVPVSVLPFRAYALIYNEFWRDQNLIDPVYINKGDLNSTEFLNNNAFSPTNYTGKVAKACKLHDYFTTCLPGTQKGVAPTIPILGTAKVKTGADSGVDATLTNGILFRQVGSGNIDNNAGVGLYQPGGNPRIKELRVIPDAAAITGTASGGPLYPSNLYADLSDGGSSVTINELRQLFAIQKLYEISARGGTRYRESIYSLFGCTSPEAVQQVPEYLGGSRTPLTITQVNNNTSQGLATFGGFTLSNGKSGFEKSFTEHGFIIGLACVRQLHTYQQGIERFWFRKDRLDFYNPLFAHLGEQAVTKKELYAFGSEVDDVFGYQEPFADLRYRPSIITGGLSSLQDNGLDVYHFGDLYTNAPVLGDQFIKETDVYVDRTLATSTEIMPQFLIDFYHSFDAIRVLPLYGIPGKIDHF